MSRLVVVGTGMRASQVTREAEAAIRQADITHYLVADRETAQLIENWARKARDLADLYESSKPRGHTYSDMVERVVEDLDQELDVCMALYGHPGVLVDPSHRALGEARRRGHQATMLPGVSAADALYADLEIDPVPAGCQHYLARDFLARPRAFDPTASLVLWQIAAIGQPGGTRDPRLDTLPLLVEALQRTYPAGHQVALYVAANLDGRKPSIHWLALQDMASGPIEAATTLYVPPLGEPKEDTAMSALISTSPA